MRNKSSWYFRRVKIKIFPSFFLIIGKKKQKLIGIFTLNKFMIKLTSLISL